MMNCLFRAAALLFLAVILVFPGASAIRADELCPMGGAMVKVAVDREKAIEWFEDEDRPVILDEEAWRIMAVSSVSDKIGMVVTEEYLFFGVADDRDDREADETRMEKAFGHELKFLRGAVQKAVKAMWKAGVIDINGGEVQKISEAVGLGTISRDGRDWVLEATDCQGMTINLEDLD